MKKSVVLLLLIVLYTQSVFSQLAVVVDKDGYVNVRNKEKQIVDKLASGEVVYCFEEEDGWVNLDYTKNGETHWQYIHKSRLRELSYFDKIPLVSISEHKALLKKESIIITLTQKDFITTSNKITRHKEGWVTRINNKDFWGTDGGIPNTEYKSITITLDKHNTEIPKAAFEDLYEPNLENAKANFDKENDILYIHSINSDGAGGYIVVWIIEKGEYKKRYVYHGF